MEEEVTNMTRNSVRHYQRDTFRFYAYKAGEGRYIARCLDLLLMGEGRTLEEAIAELNENVLGYLESVQSHGWEKDLIPCPYGWRVWLHYYWLLTLHTLKAWSGHYFGGFLSFAQRVENGRLVYA
jgi:predicted RNase H-like HicB family nuclease